MGRKILTFDAKEFECRPNTTRGFRVYCRRIKDKKNGLTLVEAEALKYDTANEFVMGSYNKEGFAKFQLVVYLRRTIKQLEFLLASKEFNKQTAKQPGRAKELQADIDAIHQVLRLKKAKVVPDRDRQKSTLKAFWKYVRSSPTTGAFAGLTARETYS